MVTPLPFFEPSLICRGAKYSLVDDIWKVDAKTCSLPSESTATGDWFGHPAFDVAPTEARKCGFCSLELRRAGFTCSSRDSD